MTELLDLCYDLLIRILEEVEPEDLAACAQTSWAFNNFLKKNTRLYRALYLKAYDDPRVHVSIDEPNWMTELQTLVRFEKILKSTKQYVKDANLRFVTSTIDKLITSASAQDGCSLTTSQLTQAFENSENLDVFLYRSSLYRHAGTDAQNAAVNQEDRQLSAKIHCLYGIPDTTAGRRALSTHHFARSRVYDLRNYTDLNQWGPFLNDGSMRVDWEAIESLMIDIGYSSGLCCPRFLPKFRVPWSKPFEGVVKERDNVLKTHPSNLLQDPEIPLDLKDPYGVSGFYSRIICFLDFHDLIRFNFDPSQISLPAGVPRQPINTEEVIRHIIMRLEVTKVELPAPCENQSLPVVHFRGRCRSLDATWDPNANSKIRGSVQLTPEGEVRWKTISVSDGSNFQRWRSDGIQVGGPRSRRGVVGTWFDKSRDHNPHAPAGPTAFWKVAELPDYGDESDNERPSTMPWSHV